MPLSLPDCTFAGPALPEPFVKFELERQLSKLSPLPSERGAEAKALAASWEVYRRKLRALGETGGDRRVLNHVIEPLAPLLGYGAPQLQDKVRTREGDEDGGWWMATADGSAGLRAWTVELGTDLDAPNRRGRAYRFSPARVAGRVLLAKGERAGLLSDGQELRLLLCDPARPDSHISVALDRTSGWRGNRNTPDSLRLLIALARPRGVAALPELIEAARLSQTTVTRKLREQARDAVRGFVQGVLDEPANQGRLDQPELAKILWEEGLILIYRLLFILKMESSPDPARAFSFSATSLWRNSYSPNTALAQAVVAARAGLDTGGFLEQSLRTLFRLFAEGLESVELRVSPLGGALFGARTTPTLDNLAWGERAVAHLLDALLWTPGDKKTERERVHYGSLDVEDLGRVYEALLELEPGISTEPMCRLRRAKLEVVVPAAQGAPYRANAVSADADAEEPEDDDEDEAPKKGKGRTTVAWVEDIPAGRFFLRTGLGRKSSGSYYTPHPFVRFLVQETLGPQVAERSPPSDPQPAKILELKVLDPAMGSGHFLVEACRFLGDALYEACRLCDERASTAEEAGDAAKAAELRARVAALPDPNDELFHWLPSRAPEGSAGGLSQKRAEGLCRRLVAVHCLYGVDKNRLAVELAKLSLWLESYAEGLPLTFMDHRLVCGDSLTGPFLEHLFTWPRAGGEIQDDLFTRGLRARLSEALAGALAGVRDLTASVGKDVADLERKAGAKARLDAALEPFRGLAAVWAGVVMLGDQGDDASYLRAVKAVVAGQEVPNEVGPKGMMEVGRGGVVYDLAFPEVFHPDGHVERTGGFDAVVGNPPWEVPEVSTMDVATLLDPALETRKVDSITVAESVIASAGFGKQFADLRAAADRLKTSANGIFSRIIGRTSLGCDLYIYFLGRMITCSSEACGIVAPAAFHVNDESGPIRRRFLSVGETAIAMLSNRKRMWLEIPAVLEFNLIVHHSRRHCAPTLAVTPVIDALSAVSQIPNLLVRLSTGNLPPSGGLPKAERAEDLRVIASMLTSGSVFGAVLPQDGIEISVGAFATALNREAESIPRDADARSPAVRVALYQLGMVPIVENKSIDAFSISATQRPGSPWDPRPQAAISLVTAAKLFAPSARRLPFFMLVGRETVGSVHTNERSSRFGVTKPGLIYTHGSLVEGDPTMRANSQCLMWVSVLNCYSVDFVVRLRIGSHLSKFILYETPSPRISANIVVFLSHSALRLVALDSDYAPLWLEQLGETWREPTPPHTWPVLAGDDARWAVRAAIDAVVADAYGLSRDQYDHILSSFSHKSYPKAHALCLAAFDELKAIGLDTFVRKHDPYHDIPLNEALPKPVIDLTPSAPTRPADAPTGELFPGRGGGR